MAPAAALLDAESRISASWGRVGETPKPMDDGSECRHQGMKEFMKPMGRLILRFRLPMS